MNKSWILHKRPSGYPKSEDSAGPHQEGPVHHQAAQDLSQRGNERGPGFRAGQDRGTARWD